MRILIPASMLLCVGGYASQLSQLSAKKKVSKRPKVTKNPKTGFGFALPTCPEEIDASVVLPETEDSLLLDKWGL